VRLTALLTAITARMLTRTMPAPWRSGAPRPGTNWRVAPATSSPMPTSRPTKAWKAIFWEAPRPSTPLPRMLSRSSSRPTAAPAPSANTATKPTRLRSNASQASTAMAQKRTPPIVGVPILTMCEEGL